MNIESLTAHFRLKKNNCPIGLQECIHFLYTYNNYMHFLASPNRPTNILSSKLFTTCLYRINYYFKNQDYSRFTIWCIESTFSPFYFHQKQKNNNNNWQITWQIFVLESLPMISSVTQGRSVDDGKKRLVSDDIDRRDVGSRDDSRSL